MGPSVFPVPRFLFPSLGLASFQPQFLQKPFQSPFLFLILSGSPLCVYCHGLCNPIGLLHCFQFFFFFHLAFCLVLNLKLRYFGHLMQRADSFENTLILGKIEGRRRRRQQRIRPWDGITDSKDMGLSGLQELVMDRVAWYTAVHGVTKSQIWLSDWTELNFYLEFCLNGFHYSIF